ncbi:hypothetical protein KSC_077880 [Ktedonobacter sp. SOSP1-52]|nr:hypothetical protein KSC_077880 [Ktedonobacter sp. SOSP1-52]
MKTGRRTWRSASLSSFLTRNWLDYVNGVQEQRLRSGLDTLSRKTGPGTLPLAGFGVSPNSFLPSPPQAAEKSVEWQKHAKLACFAAEIIEEDGV